MQRSTLTPRQERFCLLVVKGEINSRAYEQAGYNVVNRNSADASASTLLRNPKIEARIAELQRGAAQKVQISVENLTADLADVFRAAMKAEEFSSAVAAHALAARLNGLLVDHKTVDIVHHKPARQPTKAIELTEDEWLRLYKPGDK